MVKRKHISCVIIFVALFFSFLEVPVMSDEGQSPGSQPGIMYCHFIPIDEIMQEKEEPDVKSSQVIMTSLYSTEDIYINQSQLIEVWSQNISSEPRKLYHKILVRYPDASLYSNESDRIVINPGMSLRTYFTVPNTGKGIGIFNFTCEVWEEVDPYANRKHDEKIGRYRAKFYQPSGVSPNYYCEDRWHHPSNEYIYETALSAAGGRTTPRDAAIALMNYVHSYVVYDPYYRSRSSDIDVHSQRRGDCNDYADLYIGLARSVNIPTRLALGTAFTYSGSTTTICSPYCYPLRKWGHAWAESYYNGYFHHVDPTGNIMEYPLYYVNSADVHSFHASAYTGCSDTYIEDCFWIRDAECCVNGFQDVTTITDGGYDTEYYCPSDQDNDGICDNFDSDKDGDGIPNSSDGQPCGTGIGFADIPSLFLSNNFHVVGELAKCNDVLGTANISWIYGYKNIARPEGKTDLLLTATEYYTGNLIIVGGPAINPVANEFDQYFDIAYNYDTNPYDPLFQIFADGYSITLDLDNYPNEDICIVYLGRQNNRTILIIWGYGWQGTYAGSVFMSNPQVWTMYSGYHLLLLRWKDTNNNDFIEFSEVYPETIPGSFAAPPTGTPQAVSPIFYNIPALFAGFTFHVVGDSAKCTDVLGTANVSWPFGKEGMARPEGKTDLLLTSYEHSNGNLIPVGGPAINPIANEYNGYFRIFFSYIPHEIFTISCLGENKSISMDPDNYPSEDICIVYLGQHNNQNILLIWGYGWQGTYAGSLIMSSPSIWSYYGYNHLLLIRWHDFNTDGYVQMTEISVETYV
ncbi:MAG: hypothetical protein HXS48_00125 [Theionarchaea archaeon]|nr:hypothetical protein [Theionarchaea archaeon]